MMKKQMHTQARKTYVLKQRSNSNASTSSDSDTQAKSKDMAGAFKWPLYRQAPDPEIFAKPTI
jgi:hypothetical protein